MVKVPQYVIIKTGMRLGMNLIIAQVLTRLLLEKGWYWLKSFQLGRVLHTNADTSVGRLLSFGSVTKSVINNLPGDSLIIFNRLSR